VSTGDVFSKRYAADHQIPRESLKLLEVSDLRIFPSDAGRGHSHSSLGQSAKTPSNLIHTERTVGAALRGRPCVEF